jgi:hypothetical protein
MRQRLKNLVRWDKKGQSFVELAIVIPVLLFLLVGIVEVAFVYFSYMDALDLTREAARFGSTRDYRMGDVENPSGLPMSACTDAYLHYFYDTACIFIDPEINSSLPISPTGFDDVVITVVSIAGNRVTHRYPYPEGTFSLYHTSLVSGTETIEVPNWKLDCKGKITRTQPYFTNAKIESMFKSGAPTERGLVIVEVYYCYHHVIGMPILDAVIPNPTRLHAYTIMPASEAIPTPTPILPTPTANP